MGDFPVIGIRFALYADLMLLTGLAAFPFHAFDRDERRNPVLTSTFASAQRWLCMFGLLVSAIGMIVLTANMQGIAPLSVDLAMLRDMVRETGFGTAWLVGIIALLVAAGAIRVFAGRPAITAAILTVAGSTTLATLAWSGHAAATEGSAGAIHRISDILHLIAAAIWLGAIAAFLLLLRPRHGVILSAQAALAARSLDRFARVGTICVLVIAATGLINAQLIFGIANLGRSATATYGQLLLIKLLLFGSMLILAGANRWRLTPRLSASLAGGDSRTAINAIRRSLIAEALAGVAILALVAWLGTLAPLPPISAA